MTGETAVEKQCVPHVKTISVAGEQVAWYELTVTDSTMDYAVKLAGEDCSSWKLVTADKQLSGRGTHGRIWVSPRSKGLYLSLVVPPPLDAGNLDGLTVQTAGALVRALKRFAVLPFEIKHPNDVTVNGRKIAGILFESVTRGEEIMSLILGMGVNLFQSREDFINDGLTDATSLLIEAGYVPDVKCILESFLEEFKQIYAN